MRPFLILLIQALLVFSSLFSLAIELHSCIRQKEIVRIAKMALWQTGGVGFQCVHKLHFPLDTIWDVNMRCWDGKLTVDTSQVNQPEKKVT